MGIITFSNETDFIVNNSVLVNNWLEKSDNYKTQKPIKSSFFKNILPKDKSNELIINSVLSAIDFVNNNYSYSTHQPIPLYLLEYTKKHNSSIEDLGAVFKKNDGTHGLIEISTKFIKKSEQYGINTKNFVEYLKIKLGVGNFIKFIVYHETGHLLDYLIKNNMLFYKDKKSAKDINVIINPIIEDNLVERLFSTWNSRTALTKNDLHNEIIKTLKYNFQENIADSWGCLLLAQSSEKSLKSICENIKKARNYFHDGRPYNEYATSNALDKLVINVKNSPMNTPLEMIEIIQKSAEEGLYKNIEQIIHLSKKDLTDFLGALVEQSLNMNKHAANQISTIEKAQEIFIQTARKFNI